MARPMRSVISGTGLFTPPQVIENDELVESFNTWARAAGAGESDAEFILKASGIRRRHVMDRGGILDPARMRPSLPERPNDQPSIQCDMSVAAAREALATAGRTPDDVDAVIVACSNLQRAYPAVAVEVQAALGIEGWAYDMNVACSSATFGIANACDAVTTGRARSVLVVSPEICTAHLNFRDRDSHFIFGDACTAVLVERAETARPGSFEVLGTRLRTVYSNNIRNNAGFLNRCDEAHRDDADKLFVQNGRAVFKEVSPMVADLISAHLGDLGVTGARRFWLHQANLSMNQLIAKRVLGRPPTEDEAPNVLDEYANTSSAGSVIAFHLHHADMQAGDVGVLCSFGAGYSAGSVVLRRL